MNVEFVQVFTFSLDQKLTIDLNGSLIILDNDGDSVIFNSDDVTFNGDDVIW